ncbi:MAG TPA: alpha/beta hydrolase [Flavobacteriaceae bacterium]|nr:alpha/beta hydrolase [Flavobacteriaceae bacterium]HBR53652.1 alpha/beta hydrolase [Flavobacteriaceae bacterium]
MIFSYHHTPIYYNSQGNGPVLMLLHGFLESSTMWDSLLPEITKTYRVITFDFPGHGKTPSISKVHGMELFAEITSALLAQLGIAEATIIGHSMGGYVAMAMAEKYPGQIKKLILLNSTPAPDSQARIENRERALALVPKAKDAFVGMAITNLFNEASRIKFEKEISALKAEALTFPLEGITAAIAGMKDRKDRTMVLKSFSKPKYMICGVHDPILPIDDCKKIAEQTKTEFFSVNGSHMNHIENTTEIVKILHLIENKCI